MMNTNVTKWSLAIIFTIASFIIGGAGGAMIGELMLDIPDPIAGAFLAVYLATYINYFLAPSKELISSAISALCAMVVLAFVFTPFTLTTFNFFYSGVLGGLLAITFIFLTHQKHTKQLTSI